MKFPMFRNRKWIDLYPAVEDVFAGDYDQCRRAFFPVCSVDLRALDSRLQQKLHLVYFNNDPYNESAHSHFTTYCNLHSIGFDVIGHRYRFQADFGYFDMTPDWQEPYEQTCQSYAELRKRLRDTDFEYQLGGTPNWVQEDATPVDPSGRPMRFIMHYFSMFDFQDGCARDIYLFYSAAHNLPRSRRELRDNTTFGRDGGENSATTRQHGIVPRFHLI
ncbi:MAG: hypothetical protein JST22_09610 [Bacteroidetes bacterium]|nr:hypothetical protein [Bacteroidota bacterium]